MDKYEYKLRSEEIVKLIEEEKYVEAVNIADMIDWRRVKSITMLLKVAALYRVNRRNEDSRAVLLLAYDRYPTNRSVVYSLCEVSIELDDVVAAIEYYKEFVKLAPRDNGVFTLRYRILEAQEASLEERIELLEELKKRDYQEEWAYELAYLYHRVGLATKCVEECDDLILWFGDGPYVMKAMELKMLHAPLTPIQQKKYDMAQFEIQEATRSENTSVDESAADDRYEEDVYAQNQAYADGYAEDGYSQEIYAENEGYPENGYTQDIYAGNGEYSEDGYVQEDGYTQEMYAENGEYPEDGYVQEDGYTQEMYAENGEYPEDGYVQEDSYTQEMYAENGEYPEDGYVQEDGYTQEMYAENGEYSEVGSAQDDNGYIRENTAYAGEVYADNSTSISSDYNGNAGSVYHDTGSIDMSQYNTINLQKVVAESMRELFPDDEDIFAEEKAELARQEEIPAEELEENAEPKASMEPIDTMESGILTEQSETAETETSVEQPEMTESDKAEVIHTGRVAQMLTGVSEVAPEPHTGAIKKVIVPGDDARVIRQDTDIDMLRDTTEETVNEEQIRLEQNGENVYEEAPVLQQNEENEEAESVYTEAESQNEETFTPMTGQMNLEEVLSEWERMKKENETKRKEEIRQRVLQQTGKIFENFDNSIKTGILGELEEEDNPVQDDSELIRTETFLEEDDEEVEELAEIEQEDEIEDIEVSSAIEDVAQESDDEMAETAMVEAVAQETATEEMEYQENQDTEAYTDYEAADEEDLYAEEEQDTYIEEAEYEEPVMDEQTDVETEEEQDETLLKTQEIDMNTEEISSLPDKIIEATKKETKGVKKEEIREFTPEEQELFENFAVTKKIRKQIIYALDKMSLASYTGNVIITGEAGLGTLRMAKNLIREYQAMDANFSGKVAKITGEKLNMRNLKEVFEKLNNGAIIIEKANGLTQDKLYQMAKLLNQDNLGIIVIMEDTKKEITKLLEKQAMIADYFNIRIDLMEMDNNALVAYAKNYALALEYSIDELGTLALYTRIANSQSGNHVVTKDEVRDIVDEAIWKSKKFNIKNFVDVLFAKRYDQEDMIVLRERDFM